MTTWCHNKINISSAPRDRPITWPGSVGYVWKPAYSDPLLCVMVLGHVTAGTSGCGRVAHPLQGDAHSQPLYPSIAPEKRGDFTIIISVHYRMKRGGIASHLTMMYWPFCLILPRRHYTSMAVCPLLPAIRFQIYSPTAHLNHVYIDWDLTIQAVSWSVHRLAICVSVCLSMMYRRRYTLMTINPCVFCSPYYCVCLRLSPWCVGALAH